MLLTVLTTSALAAGGQPLSEPDSNLRPAWIAAPLVSYDSNLLLGLGGFGGVIWPSADPERPFALRLSAQIYATTGGYQNHFLRFEWPGIGGSAWRWRSEARFIDWTLAPYYGTGNSTPLLRDPAPGYYTYHKRTLQLRQDLRYGLGGAWSLFGTWSTRNERIETFADTLLSQEQPTGMDGGRYSWAALGLMWDSRDQEIDPSSGVFAHISARTAHPWLGSDYQVIGGHLGLSTYKPLGGRVVWASNLALDAHVGDEPFFNSAYVGGLGRGIIGGRWSFRGLPEERYHGDGLVLVQQELRVRVYEHSVGENDLAWILVPFTDIGRVWSWQEQDPLLHLHATVGCGLRVNIRDLAILRADLGVGLEEYVDGKAPRVQLYVLSEHPF